MNKFLKILWYSIYIGIFTFIAIYFLSKNSNLDIPSNIDNALTQWVAETWSWDPTTILNNSNEFKLVIFSWSLINDSLDIIKYPKIKINSKIKTWKLIYEIEPIDSIRQYGYFKSDTFYFAFRFFIGDFKNWGYYNVFRNTNDWVQNDLSLNLNWAVSWSKLLKGFSWEIPLSSNIKISKDKDSYWYANISTLGMINSYLWKEINVGWFLSSIKEFPEGWWKITKIKSIVLIYEWEKNAIEVIN